MEGPDQEMLFSEKDFSLSDLSGILPRTAVHLFKEKERLMRNFKRSLDLEISAIEIYCEEIRDLFNDDGKNGAIGLELIHDKKAKKPSLRIKLGYSCKM